MALSAATHATERSASPQTLCLSSPRKWKQKDSNLCISSFQRVSYNSMSRSVRKNDIKMFGIGKAIGGNVLVCSEDHCPTWWAISSQCSSEWRGSLLRRRRLDLWVLVFPAPCQRSLQLELQSKTREVTISAEIVGCACLHRLQRGQFFYEISTTDISVYFI